MVSFVYCDLIVIALERCYNVFKFVRDIKFGTIKEQNDSIGTLCKMLCDCWEIIATNNTLLFAGKNTRGVQESEVLKYWGINLSNLEFTQKRRSVSLKGLVRKICLAACSVAYSRCSKVALFAC